MNAADLGRFLETHAIPLPEPFDGASADLSVLSPLAARIADAEIVALGEMNYFVHEKTDFRLFLSRFLISCGWTDFAEEIGWSDGVRINRFLSSGDESQFDRLPSFGYVAHLRDDRDDRPGGILRSASYPTEAFVFEERRFYRGVRDQALRLGKQARAVGIDIDGLPGGSYEDVAALLPVGAKDGARFLKALARVPHETPREEAERLGRALVLIPSDWPREISESVRALSESLDYIALTYVAKTYDEVRPGVAYRENAMKRRLGAARRLMGSSRMVVMAHALHLAKDDTAIISNAVGPGANRVSSLGHWLVQEQKQKVFSVWFLYGSGEDSQPLASLPNRANFPPHSLNALLCRHGRSLLFFPAAAPELFRKRCSIGHMYNSLFEAPLAVQADAVVFLPSVTPLRTA